MSHCNHCSGNCGSCGGCSASLVLTEAELTLLQGFAQLPFQSVVRKSGEELPVWPEAPTQENALALACLEKKGLIDIDFHCPLKGFDYTPWPHHLQGSAALTARGQEILDTISLQGTQEA